VEVTGGAGGETGANGLHGLRNPGENEGAYSIRPAFDPLRELWLNARLFCGRLAQW
jgi:hypothetical protein